MTWPTIVPGSCYNERIGRLNTCQEISFPDEASLYGKRNSNINGPCGPHSVDTTVSYETSVSSRQSDSTELRARYDKGCTEIDGLMNVLRCMP